MDIGDDPGDYVVGISDRNGNLVTVKRTVINTAHEVLITINGRPNCREPLEALSVGSYTIRLYSYENDSIPSIEVPIISHEVKGKSVQIVADL